MQHTELTGGTKDSLLKHRTERLVPPITAQQLFTLLCPLLVWGPYLSERAVMVLSFDGGLGAVVMMLDLNHEAPSRGA